MQSFSGMAVRALIAALAVALACAPQVAHAGVDARQRIDDWLAANGSFRSKFTQSVFDEDGVRISMTRGTVSFRRPYRFRWDYDPPGAQTLVADGRELWWYDVDLRQATVRPVEAALAGTPAALLAGPRGADEHFRIAALDPAGEVDWYELVPQSADAAFRAIRIGLRGGDLRAVEMDDGFGQTTRIEFFATEYNPTLADELFRFEPPPEADIVRDE